MRDRPGERRLADRRRGDRRRGTETNPDLSSLQRRIDRLEALAPGVQAKIDQLSAAAHDDLRRLGVDTSARRRMDDISFGVMLLADAIERAGEMGAFDDDVKQTIDATIEWVLRMLRPLEGSRTGHDGR